MLTDLRPAENDPLQGRIREDGLSRQQTVPSGRTSEQLSRHGSRSASCANIALAAACQLVEASTDPNGGWHTEACHPVQHVASNFCFDLLTGQSPGEESPSNDGFVPIHRSLNETSSV
jgi:hypothetical protein